ncbi:TPA: hypothetical protein N0F65_001395 [Lagenidium giganteum]|uniref:Palmitoyl-protein thioesterase 1 n=1 Tax=Lagenidium giganteum TaxID=4803 RepID=A0AAV2Z2I2_9STRA|nr:TPA: hypothetical protein N0F65_001395 [Lagenidium giganteum]
MVVKLVRLVVVALCALAVGTDATEKVVKREKVYEQLQTPPVVLMHGMGDAAGNSGMKHIRDLISKHLGGTYVTNIQLGNSIGEDVQNSYLITMDKQLDMFAAIVRKVSYDRFRDPKLANGFNAAGFSQGNLLIRGYIERYNNPPVLNFISFHGPLAGVGALPQCKPTQFICREINRLIGTQVYSDRVQKHLAQSNYFRDPLKIDEYLQHVHFLPDLNNEGKSVNATYKENFIKLHNLALVRANADTQVVPKDAEWFGAYADGSNYDKILGFNETRWYKEDLFGLQTLDRAGKVHFFETAGDHLRFSNDFILSLVDRFFQPTLI